MVIMPTFLALTIHDAKHYPGRAARLVEQKHFINAIYLTMLFFNVLELSNLSRRGMTFEEDHSLTRSSHFDLMSSAHSFFWAVSCIAFPYFLNQFVTAANLYQPVNRNVAQFEEENLKVSVDCSPFQQLIRPLALGRVIADAAFLYYRSSFYNTLFLLLDAYTLNSSLEKRAIKIERKGLTKGQIIDVAYYFNTFSPSHPDCSACHQKRPDIGFCKNHSFHLKCLLPSVIKLVKKFDDFSFTIKDGISHNPMDFLAKRKIIFIDFPKGHLPNCPTCNRTVPHNLTILFKEIGLETRINYTDTIPQNRR